MAKQNKVMALSYTLVMLIVGIWAYLTYPNLHYFVILPIVALTALLYQLYCLRSRYKPIKLPTKAQPPSSAHPQPLLKGAERCASPSGLSLYPSP